MEDRFSLKIGGRSGRQSHEGEKKGKSNQAACAEGQQRRTKKLSQNGGLEIGRGGKGIRAFKKTVDWPLLKGLPFSEDPRTAELNTGGR